MKAAVALCLLSLFPVFTWAASAVLTPEEAFKESDALALIRVLSVSPLPGQGKYCRTALAEVVEPVKALHSGDRFNLDFDTSDISPNVLYTEKEQAIVVLRLLPSGHYETKHAACGKFSVEEGAVQDCYLLGDPGKVPESVPVDDAIRQLRIKCTAAQSPE